MELAFSVDGAVHCAATASVHPCRQNTITEATKKLIPPMSEVHTHTHTHTHIDTPTMIPPHIPNHDTSTMQVCVRMCGWAVCGCGCGWGGRAASSH